MSISWNQSFKKRKQCYFVHLDLYFTELFTLLLSSFWAVMCSSNVPHDYMVTSSKDLRMNTAQLAWLTSRQGLEKQAGVLKLNWNVVFSTLIRSHCDYLLQFLEMWSKFENVPERIRHEIVLIQPPVQVWRFDYYLKIKKKQKTAFFWFLHSVEWFNVNMISQYRQSLKLPTGV